MVAGHGHGGHGSHGAHGRREQYKPVSKGNDDKARRTSHNLGRLAGRESFLTSTISIFVDENQPLIPDGGWGWLVVLSSLFINLVSDGITCCFGLLYIDFLNEFGASKSATSWIGSLYVAVPLVGGPIGSALVDRYGCMKMTIVGALISTTGFILSTFAKNIMVMYITFGFLGGIGLALCYVTAVVAIAFWFDTKRTLALGLAAAGCGFGTVIYSPLITLLSYEFGWRGTVLILAGLFANMCVCGLLQRDPDWIIKQEKDRLEAEKNEKNINKPKNGITKYEPDLLLEKVRTTADIKQKDRFHSVLQLPTYIAEHKKVPLEVLRNLSNDKHLYKVILENYPNLLTTLSHSDSGPDKIAHEASLVNTRVPVKYSMQITRNDREHKLEPPGFRNHIKNQSNGHLQHGYLANIKLKKELVDVENTLMDMGKYKITASCPEDVWVNDIQIPAKSSAIEPQYVEKKNRRWYHDFREAFGDVIDFTLFLDLHFFLVSISTILMCIWFAVPFVYLADHMKSIGYNEIDTSLTISVIGATNVLGMIIIGFLGTRMKVVTLYAICLFLSGGCCAAMMLFSSNYYILLVSSGAFGLFYACQHSLTPAVVALLVPLEKFSMAYGLSLLCQGIGKLTGPPLAGYIFDITQSYSQSFYQASVWIFIAGILIGVIPYTKDRRLFCKR